MDQDKFKKFLDGTFETERQNYRKRAIANHRYYDWLLWAITGLSLISALAIGVEAFFDLLALKITAAVASILVSALTATLKGRGYQEKATLYTRYLNELNSEWDFYVARVDHYSKTDDPEQYFVMRVRAILNQSTSSIPNMTVPGDK